MAVNALGHAHPRLIRALEEQAKKLWHVSNLFAIPGQQRLAKRLCENSFAGQVFFCNSGAEAVEAAIKTARRAQFHHGHQQRYRLITFEGAFHGRTLATLAAGGKKAHLEGFGPVADGFDKLAAGDLELVEKAIGEETAGILIEPVQGEGGVNVMDPAFLRGLRQLCDEHGLYLIFDEVQTGMGRTGKLFAYQWAGVEPDIMAVAKGIGGGFPLGACLATNHAAEGMTAGSHGSTFGGNPLAMAVGNEVLSALLEPGFLEDVEAKGLYARQKLAAIEDEFPGLVREVRGQGLLIGVALKIEPGKIIPLLREEKVLAVPAADNVLRFLPPLNCSRAEIDEAISGLEAAFRKYKRLRNGS